MSELAAIAYSAIFEINAVAAKLPEFWADNARIWFAVQGFTSSLTKFYY